MPSGESSLTDLAAALADRYRIVQQIGEGGMATVYLAHDERHDRNVAIKIVHEDLGASLGQDRFLAEIKTTARLQHPHILPLLDSGSTATNGGDAATRRLFYVMPFVEGESLRERLQRERQLPIDDALRIAREAGDALAYAHDHGVVHRDVKPENILLQGGHALVADFGIALAVQHASGARMTQTGLSLGTPQYMAPEQAAGDKTVDARADQYALGAVLYEMLTGEPPFTGATVQAVIAKVLSADPEPPRTIRKTVTLSVEAAVLRALSKLPADRFANVRAFVAALDAPVATLSPETGPRPRIDGSDQRRAWRVGGLAGLVLGLFGGVTLGFLAWRARASTESTDVSRTYLEQPPEEALAAGTTNFTFTPNGDLIYVGPGGNRNTAQLWRKRRAELHATRIPGTEGGQMPVVSPDGKWIAFATDAGLQRVSVDGGSAAMLSPDLFFLNGRGAWLRNGHLIVSSHASVFDVPSDGTRPTLVVTANQFAGYDGVRVVALPGEKAILVQACPVTCRRSVVYAVDLLTHATQVVIPDGRNPVYLSTGDLAWISRAGQLMVAPFDARSISLRAGGRPVADHVASFEVSPQGDLLYREAQSDIISRPVFVDRLGNVSVIDSSWAGEMLNPAVSADGKRLAVAVVSPNDEQIWIKELPWGAFSKFTLDGSDHFRPSWSPDGRVIRFVQRVDSAFVLMERRADGASEAHRVPIGSHEVVDASTSADGQWLVMRTGGGDTSRAILAIHEGVDTAARVVPAGPGYKGGVTVSPDGHYIAFTSVVAGTSEVFVSPFPNAASARWQVSQNGGEESRWANNGKELFFVTPHRDLMVASLSTAPSFAISSVNKLFRLDGYACDGSDHAFEVMPGDQRFLMFKTETQPGHLVLVSHWADELASRRTP